MSNMDSIDIQVSASAKNANAELDKLIVKLGAVQKSLSRIGGKSTNFGTKIKSQSNTATDGLNKVSTSMNKATKSTTSLASAFGTLYANFFWVIRGAKSLKSSLDSTSDYIEDFNYYTVAFDKIASEWDSLYGSYGSENAQKYTNAFVTQMNEELGKMSGVKLNLSVDMESGTLSSSDSRNLALNLQEVTQYASQLASITNSVGQNGTISSTASSVFTKLAGDISSLKNVDYSTVANNLQSGLIGQSRALYKYGIDITNATLQTYAYELGLEKAVSEMTQAEKMQLRMIAILDQSKVAWGDLANTINSPSNMLRQFTNNLKEAGMVLGQLFIPLLSKVMPVINGITIAIKNLLTSIAGFFGIKLDLSEFGQGFSGMEDDIDGVTDSLDDATASAKKFKGQLQGFDKLNVITTQSDSGASSSVGGGIDLTDEILNATEEYQKAWDEAFAKMENKAIEFSKKVEKALEPVKQLFKDISIGDWFAVGQDVSNIVVGITDFISNAIANVDWEKLGENIGSFIEGIEFTEILSSVGKLIWEAINASIELWKGLFDASPIGATILGGILLTPAIKNISTLFTATLIPAFTNFITFGSNVIGVFELMKNVGMTLSAAMTTIFGTFTTVFIGIVSILAGAGLAVTSFVSMFTEGFSWIKEAIMVAGIALTAFGVLVIGLPSGISAAVVAIVAGIVAAVATVAVVIHDNWDSIVEWTSGLFENIKNKFNAIKNNVLIPFGNYLKDKFGFEFEVVFGSIKGVIDGLKQAFNGLIAFITGVFTGDWKRAWNGVKDIFKGIFNGLISIVEGAINLIVVNGINNFLKGFNGVVTKIGDVIGLDISIPQIKKISIPRFETGGFPEDGFFFANHNELVGQFSNGNTAVANNEQIVAGIKEGVREAVAEVLAPYLADIADSSRRTANKDFTVASRDIFEAVRTENRDYINRNGESAFV